MNEITLTPNRRLSATLHKLFNKKQQEEQHQCWRTPDILPLSSWLQKLWQQRTLQQVGSLPMLLNPQQEQFLWEKILLNAKESQQLLQVHETAELVKSAYTLLKQWRVDINHPVFQSAEDYAALVKWINEYRAICRRNNWIDESCLPDLLPDRIALPEIINLNGFTELSPQIQQFLKSCKQNGTQVRHTACSQVCESSQRIALEDSEEEILTIARWARAIYENDDNAKIACVIPELESRRDRVAQIFAQVFADTEAYNISAGKQLTQYPLIDTALQLLALYKKKTTDVIFSYLLSSPFTGEAETERAQRSSYDVYLRKSNITTVDLYSLLKTTLAKYCPRLADRIAEFLKTVAEILQPQTYHAWANTFNELLRILGWPGERSLSSVEYQVVECWLELLNKFSTLDQVADPANFQQALSVIHKMAAKTIFQAKTPDAPIQILGVLEAAGIPFDHVWLAGMNDISWPPQPRPNPFIPKSLQRELNMPHATAEREFMFCNTLIQQFKSCTKHIIFSHAKAADELEFKASPLTRDEREIDLEQLQLPPYLSPGERVFQSKRITTLIDDKAPSLASDDKITGGVNIIKHQAACPFRAFAQWRLHAQELESPLPGLRPKDRGNILHKALELIWSRLHDHASLNAMAEIDLRNLIADCVNESMSSLPDSHNTLIQYIGLEKQRLRKILWEWLAIEKSRPPFRVFQNEMTVEYKFRQFAVNIRIDRVDELDDGSKLIIDYKTGKNNSIDSWFESRLDEPQLPLYALVDPERTIGICFAQIAAGAHGFKGVSQHDLNIKGIKPVQDNKQAASSWEEQLAAWQQNLAQIADDFSSGKASVDPKDPGETCAWCALEPLCRKNEEIALTYEQ